MVPRATNMTDQDDGQNPEMQDPAAPQQVTPTALVQSPATEMRPTIDTDTRRTSTSSAGMQSSPSRDQQVTGSMHASFTSGQSGDGGQAQRTRSRPRPQRLDYGSMRAETGSRQQILSPQTSQPSQSVRRPAAGRRMPSSAAPHRGEHFSVDDDPDEVDLDMRLARTHTKQDGAQAQRERQAERERQLRRTQSTLRRRPGTAQPPALRTVDSEEHEEHAAAQVTGNDASATATGTLENGDPSSEETLQGEEEEEGEVEGEGEGETEEMATPDDEDPANLSDTESFTLKDRQEAINETHPFGIRIWKPALYKKNRSVQRNAEGDIHSAPGGNVSSWLWTFNCLWTIIFGWWLSLIAAVGGILCMLLSFFQLPGCFDYGRVLINLSHYLFYPFGKYVKLERDEAYLEEDEGEGRSISEYERWQTGDLEEGRLFFGPTDVHRSLIGRRRDEVEDLEDETDSLLGRQRRESNPEGEAPRSKTKKRLFGRGKWNLGRVIFFLSFYFLITPCLFLVSGICWFLVFTIPMGKVTLLLFYHLRRHPLAMSFHTDSHYARANTQSPISRGTSGSSILLCTYRAVGLKYWKYTIDGTNIFLINLLGLVVFVIFDYFILYGTLGIEIWLTSMGLVFVMALASIIPLAYFIGQAVASISAQSSMGVGATINAFFSTVVEVFLYCVALKEGKALLVEGSIIGSIFAGILFLPGLSMCFGALRRKTQRFNVRSAGVTSTMLLFAVIGAFGPTLFYQIYGSHELNCHQCVDFTDDSAAIGSGAKASPHRDCRRCYFAQQPTVQDKFYIEAVQPYIYFATVCLFLSYIVGLMFTLRTHAAVIWNNEPDEKKVEPAHKSDGSKHASVPGTAGLVEDPRGHAGHQRRTSATPGTAVGSLPRENVRDSQMYKRILNQSLKQAGLGPNGTTTPGTVKKQQQQQQQDGGEREVSETSMKNTADGSLPSTPFIVPPKTPDGTLDFGGKGTAALRKISGLSAEDNRALVQEIAEMAATAATVAARDATKAPRRASVMATTQVAGLSTGSMSASHAPKHHGSASSKDSSGQQLRKVTNVETGSLGDSDLPPDVPATATTAAGGGGGGAGTAEQPAGGHDAPNWSRTKSAVILLTATVAYAIIAEILVDTVDAVLSNIDIDEKFLGITLFALVPNTTEFLNAISFAMNGNVALSMEIGSSYALQVILLQTPALILFSAIYAQFLDADEVLSHTFTLIFPQWDMVTVILGVFLMGWVVGEGKSNYFKGSILIFTYLVVVVGFWFSSYNNMDVSHVFPACTFQRKNHD